jgi:hypothetical protein
MACVPSHVLEPIGLPVMQHAEGGVVTHFGQLLCETACRRAFLSRFFGRLGLACLAPSCQSVVAGGVSMKFGQRLFPLTFAALLLIGLLNRLGFCSK